MAGLQSCILVIKRSIRLINKNGVFHQSNRGKHFLAYQLCPKGTQQFNRNSKLFVKSDLKHLFRLASTDITNNVTQKISTPETPKISASEQPKADQSSNTVNSSPTVATETSADSNVVIDESTLPPAPSTQENIGDFEFVYTGLKEPTFESLGLGGYWPTGLIQQGLEFLHINLDMPWWAAIGAMTIFFRIITFPVAVKTRKNAINLNNNLPQLQLLNLKLTEARKTGNYYDAARFAQELQVFMKEKKIAALGTILPAIVQAPIFVSMFWALKSMAAAPVESMKTGGLFWFEDLTAPDPYYILPIVTATTLWIALEVGAEGQKIDSSQAPFVKIFLRVIPFAVLPFSIRFSEGILWYWTVSNFITLGQVVIFKIPAVNKFLNLPEMIKHDPAKLPVKKKGAIEGFKEGMANMKVTRELEERESLNTITFENAGKGSVPRTFKTNPKAVPGKAAAKIAGK